MKILFLTSNYLPNPSANGINTMNVINELEKKGHNVSCICVATSKNYVKREKIGETDVIRISQSHFSEILNLDKNKSLYLKLIVNINIILRKILNMLKVYKFPSFDQKQNEKVYFKATEILNEDQYDCVIGIFKPYSNIFSLMELKKNKPNLIVIGYFLDLLSSINKPKIMPDKLYEKLLKKRYTNILNQIDGMLIPENSNKEIGLKEFHKSEKIKTINYPTFILENYDQPSEIKSEQRQYKEINLVYAGTLDKQYRNPENALKILSSLSKDGFKINLDIYGKNNCQDIISEYNQGDLIINLKGLKKHDEVIDRMREADFLVNISNQNINAIPSKIFEMFSQARPIINFVGNNSDITLKYFDKYPANINIFSENNIFENKVILKKFIEENKNLELDKNCLKKIYLTNTPEYTVDQILDLIKKADTLLK